MMKWFPQSAIKTPREERLQLARDCGLIQGRVVMYYLSHFTADTDNDIEEVRALVLEKDVEGLLQNQSIDMMKDIIGIYAIKDAADSVSLLAIIDPFELYLDPRTLGFSTNVNVMDSVLSSAYDTWEVEG